MTWTLIAVTYFIIQGYPTKEACVEAALQVNTVYRNISLSCVPTPVGATIYMGTRS